MKMKCLGLLILFILLRLPVIQAQNKLDSLLIVLNNYSKEDSVKVKILLEVSELYIPVDPNKGIINGIKCMALAKKIKSKLLCECMGFIGDNYKLIDNLDSADYYYKQQRTIAKKDGNKKALARAYNNLANIQSTNDDYKGALQNYYLSIDILKEIKQETYSRFALINIAGIYVELYNFPKALALTQQCIDVSTLAGDNDMVSYAYSQMVSIYIGMEQFDKALLIAKKGLKIAEVNEDESQIAIANSRLGSIFKGLLLYDSAEVYFKKSLAWAITNHQLQSELAYRGKLATNYIFQKKFTEALDELKMLKKYNQVKNYKIILSFINIESGRIYINCPNEILQQENIEVKDRYKIAIDYLNRGKEIASSINKLDYVKDAFELITLANERQNDYVAAYEGYRNYIKVRDSIINDKKKEELKSIEMQYSFDKTTDSIKLVQANINIELQQQQFLNKQQSQNLLLQNNKLLLSQQQLALSNKEKDLQHLAFLKTQADLQTEQLQKSENEKQLTIAQKEKQLQSAQVKTLSQENDLNKLRRRQQLIYGAGGFALLFFGGLLFFNRSRHKQAKLKADLEKEKAQQQQKEAEFQRSLADVSMSALRSQMNPHFIFNCLNSIKLYTTQNDTVSAAAYLTKFSKLIRMALENSRSETVTLKAELESLDLYIQMEAMRFKDKLQYSIVVDENVDSNFIEIPPLLLQPYVENAIWHGLMHKEEGGKIAVAVSVLPNEPVLVIAIQDNGVGREKSAELRSNTAGKHKSYGTKVTSERLDLINKVYKTGASVTTEDVKNELGEIAGTLVTIKIPFE